MPGLLLLAACGAGPREDFDGGVVVHFILVRERAPKEDVTLQPVFTVGESAVRAPAVTFGPEHALAQETAVVRVRREESARVAFWDPVTRQRAEDTFDARHELWIVVDLGADGEGVELSATKKPPNRDLQEWVPLAEMSD